MTSIDFWRLTLYWSLLLWHWLLAAAGVTTTNYFWFLMFHWGSAVWVTTNHLPSSPLLGVSTSSDEDLDNDLRQGIDNIMYVRFPHFLHDPTHPPKDVQPPFQCIHPHLQPTFRACFSTQYMLSGRFPMLIYRLSILFSALHSPISLLFSSSPLTVDHMAGSYLNANLLLDLDLGLSFTQAANSNDLVHFRQVSDQ